MQMLRAVVLLSLLCPVLAAADSLANLATVQEGVARRASSTDPDPEGNADARTIAPGETLVLADLEGPGIIRHFWNTVNSDEPGYSRLLALRIYWDDETEPSVEAPLGDFFASGHGLDRNVDSLPVQVVSDGRGRNCFWPMPFRKRARVTVTNEGRSTVASFYWYINWEQVKRLPRNTAYFHAMYRQEFPGTMGTRFQIADIVGRGHYVGTVQAVRQRLPLWHGEGDDFFHLDGDTEPTLSGTGTEDYFNDAWGFREDMRAYAGVVLYEGEKTGDRSSVYRWHIADPIRFRQSCRVEIEHTGPIAGPDGELGYGVRPDDISTVAFWYQVEPHQPWAPMPLGYERLHPGEITPATFGADAPEEYVALWVRSQLLGAGLGVAVERALPAPGAVHTVEVPLSNPLTVPVTGRMSVRPHPDFNLDAAPEDHALAPGEARAVAVRLRAADALPRVPGPVGVDWTLAYAGADGAALSTVFPMRVVFDPELPIADAPAGVVVDGDLSEWTLDLALETPAQIQMEAALWTGPDDASARFAVARDDRHLYIAGSVVDDFVVADAVEVPWRGDGVELRICALPGESLDAYRGHREFTDSLLIAFTPAPDGGAPNVFMRDRLPAGLRVACVRTGTGYDFEVAVPHAALDAMQGGPWQRLRLNLCLDDTDADGRLTQLWWRPDWRTGQSYPGSGKFKR